MPIIWRHLIFHFLKIFFFCLVTLVTVLLITRLDDIAHFASLGAESKLILWYFIFQIPYILPITIPLSCLIAAMILMQRLTSSHELTALRSAGLSFINILEPIFFLSLIGCVINFVIISEIATRTHLATTLLKTELRSINPLFALHNKHLIRSKGYVFHPFGNSIVGESVSQSIIASPGRQSNRMNLLVANFLSSDGMKFLGNGVTFIMGLENKGGQSERLVIENAKLVEAETEDFKKMITKQVWSLNNDHLSLPLLVVRLQNQIKKLDSDLDVERIQSYKEIKKCISELFRRISVAIAPLTFTLMGSVFGISSNRLASSRGVYCVLLFSSIYLICFFSAKSTEHRPLIAASYYFAPHLLILLVSAIALFRLTKGKSFT